MQEDTEQTLDEAGPLTELAQAAQTTGTTSGSPKGTPQDSQGQSARQLVRQGFWLGVGIWLAFAVLGAAVLLLLLGIQYLTGWVSGEEVHLNRSSLTPPGFSSHR